MLISFVVLSKPLNIETDIILNFNVRGKRPVVIV